MSTRSNSRVRHSRRMPGALGEQLRRLAGWAVASSLGAAIGCGEAPSDPGGFAGDASLSLDWQAVPCDSLLLVTDPIAPAHALDYFAIIGPNVAGATTLISDYGNPCESANDHAACISRLRHLRESTQLCGPPVACKSFTVMTHGDRVERQTGSAQLNAVLGDIDTGSEAVVAAMLQGLMLSCPNPAAGLEASSGTQIRAISSGYRVRSQWHKCSASIGNQTIDVKHDGSTSALDGEITSSNCVVGRRPRGIELARARGDCEPLAMFLADTAQLEAASVHAFERLRGELLQLGAARPLLAAARRSADDERRHTRLTAALARRYGGEVLAPKLPTSSASTSALAVALENATEGCVRETFGAIIAWHQAARARDPHVARVMAEIAADETRHAELSWDIAEWLEPRLSERDRAVVCAARATAVRELEREIAVDGLPEPARELIGVPAASVQRALLDRMTTQLGLS